MNVSNLKTLSETQGKALTVKQVLNALKESNLNYEVEQSKLENMEEKCPEVTNISDAPLLSTDEMMNSRTMQFSLEFAYLQKLFGLQLISNDEYLRIKNQLMADYDVVSTFMLENDYEGRL